MVPLARETDGDGAPSLPFGRGALRIARSTESSVNVVGECCDTYSTYAGFFSGRGINKGEGRLPLRLVRVSRSAICFLWRELVAYCNG